LQLSRFQLHVIDCYCHHLSEKQTTTHTHEIQFVIAHGIDVMQICLSTVTASATFGTCNCIPKLHYFHDITDEHETIKFSGQPNTEAH